jgi:quinol monooxygenase YgiN
MIARMIYAKVAPDQIDEARRVWKEHCAPLMIETAGCISEQLLASRDRPGELISYALWESQQAIDAYRKSPEHDEIQKRTRQLLSGAAAEVKTYEVVS